MHQKMCPQRLKEIFSKTGKANYIKICIDLQFYFAIRNKPEELK